MLFSIVAEIGARQAERVVRMLIDLLQYGKALILEISPTTLRKKIQDDGVLRQFRRKTLLLKL